MKGSRRLVRVAKFLRTRQTLPLRMWLILAVAAITGAGFVAQITLTQILVAWEQRVDESRLASVRRAIGTDPSRWRTQAWQQLAQPSFTALRVEVALYPTPSGPATYSTPAPVASLT